MSLVRSLPDPNEEARVRIATRTRLNAPVFLLDEDAERVPGVPADERMLDLVPPVKATRYVLEDVRDPDTGKRSWRWKKSGEVR